MKTSVYIATSLDGFIARQDGALDWLGSPAVDDAEDYGYKTFIDSVDVLVMGRNSYEKVLTFEGWPYGSKPVVVLSNHALRIPEPISTFVETMSCSPSELIEQLSARGAKHLYIDGGKTIQGFLDAGLIERLIITRVPVIIGDGIPLFGPLGKDVKLRHIATRSFPAGLVQSEYEIAA